MNPCFLPWFYSHSSLEQGFDSRKVPEEILSLICRTTEDFSHTHTPFSWKHTKKITVLTLSQVCHTWRFHINTNASLWNNIAFDLCDPPSIKLAHNSLGVMEKTDTLFSVYASLHSDIRPATRFFSQLQPLIGRVVRFEYFGELGECGRYLDCPAENLRHLSGPLDLDPSVSTIFSRPIFTGKVPRLRSIAMPSAIHCVGVRNMVFFKLFPSYFYDFSLVLPPPHSFLSVSLFKEKTIRVLLII